MRTTEFDFDLPEDRIALHPAVPRDAARLLVVRPGDGSPLGDHVAADLPSLLRPDDVLVFNDTRVIPAALEGTRIRGSHETPVSFNLIKRVDESRWRAFAQPARRLEVGDLIRFGAETDGRVCLLGTLDATVASKLDDGEVELAFSFHGAFLDEAIDALGQMPLPPYIASRRMAGPEDRNSYQTMFARREGAVAAPTAALHFTPELVERLKAAGMTAELVTLHVGAGTFLPVKVEDTDDHRMHFEWGEVTPGTAERLTAARRAGRRIVAVGTTALRLLEATADADGSIRPFHGETGIFITPGYRFRAVDVLMTNFHLPCSTLFMLVAAFSGLETMKSAYAHAIAQGYRFYSYGDACLLHPAPADRSA
jgi:S-adenosylmethionine:tRNA ribosyltransferase-isomerase